MKWTNSYRSFGLKTKRSTGLKTIEHKHAVEFHIPTEHFMSSLTKVSSTTRARHRAWIRRHARGVWRAAIEAGAYRTERFVALAMVQWPGPSIYPVMSCAETLKSEEPGELKGAERK